MKWQKASLEFSSAPNFLTDAIWFKCRYQITDCHILKAFTGCLIAQEF